jgi:hypothetical protein
MKIGNPAKILFDDEEDMLVALGVKEPEVTATIPEQELKPQYSTT